MFLASPKIGFKRKSEFLDVVDENKKKYGSKQPRYGEMG